MDESFFHGFEGVRGMPGIIEHEPGVKLPRDRADDAARVPVIGEYSGERGVLGLKLPIPAAG